MEYSRCIKVNSSHPSTVSKIGCTYSRVKIESNCDRERKIWAWAAGRIRNENWHDEWHYIENVSSFEAHITVVWLKVSIHLAFEMKGHNKTDANIVGELLQLLIVTKNLRYNKKTHQQQQQQQHHFMQYKISCRQIDAFKFQQTESKSIWLCICKSGR